MAKGAVTASSRIPVMKSSGNIFADLGVAEPEEELAKTQLASHIRDIIRRQRLTQVQAAQRLGMDQPKVSALVNGRLSGFSSDRLLRCLAALGQNVEIIIRTESRRGARGQIRVVAAA